MAGEEDEEAAVDAGDEDGEEEWAEGEDAGEGTGVARPWPDTPVPLALPPTDVAAA